MRFQQEEQCRILACPLFEGISSASVEILSEEHNSEIQTFSEGEIIVSPDQKQKAIGCLLSGKAEISTPDHGKPTLLRCLQIGEPFGVAALFSDHSYVSRITAQKRCRVFFLRESAVRRLLETDSVFLYHYLEFLSSRIRFLNQKIGYLTAGSAERRLSLYLLSQNTDTVALSGSVSELSERLDIGRASLYRAFEKLEKDGYIQKDGRTVRLLHSEALLQAYQ